MLQQTIEAQTIEAQTIQIQPIEEQHIQIEPIHIQPITTPLLDTNVKTNNYDSIMPTINSCIICLDDDVTENILEPKDMHFLIKNCSCQFYIHEKCFNLWFFKKSVCPICTSPIFYNEEMTASEEDPLIYYPTNYKNGEYVFLQATPNSGHCVKTTLLILFLLLTIFFLFSYFFPVFIVYK
jgi:hypothetical protein